MNYIEIMKKLGILLIAIIGPLQLIAHAVAGDFSILDGVLERRMPHLAGKVAFYPLSAAPADSDVFKIYRKGNVVAIEATSVPAAGMAITEFLRVYCHQSISRAGNNITGQFVLPPQGDTLVRSSKFGHRYALNYCTYNYSYSFYQWEDWEWELDWMVLNGVNLMLAPIGMEAVWKTVLKQLGCGDEIVTDYVAGPAFTGFWLMGCLQGWGGPVTVRQIEAWSELQQRILSRMSEFQIEPILQGFMGIVPSGLAEKFPDTKFYPPSHWAGHFPRPLILDPHEPLYDRIAKAYYQEIRVRYGDAINYFGGDLFHEGAPPDGVEVGAVTAKIQQQMQTYFPNSIWILQGWGLNPSDEMLRALQPTQTTVIDLFGENRRTWADRNHYAGFPWIWASINNFGGKTDMGGQLPRLISEPHYVASASENVTGIGILPEGIMTNPVVYDWALRTAWEKDTPGVRAYMEDYIRYRYGKSSQDMESAWELLLQSVYADTEVKWEGNYESIFCARPGMEVKNVSSWGAKEPTYDPIIAQRALAEFLKAGADYQGSDTYTYDLVDLARQVLANHGRAVYRAAIAAYHRQDREALEAGAAEFIALIHLQDELSGTRAEFMLGTWLEKAKHYGPIEESALNERNARMLLSYWGPDNPETELHDYAHREWSGLLTDLYLPRWKLFFDDLINQLNGGKPGSIDYFSMEKAWSDAKAQYPVEPQGCAITLAGNILQAVVK